MLLGNWRNFEELEDSLSYPEVEAMVKAKREVEHRHLKWQAALQGIDIDKNKTAEDDPVERIKRRIRAKQQGVGEEELRFKESAQSAGFAVIRK